MKSNTNGWISLFSDSYPYPSELSTIQVFHSSLSCHLVFLTLEIALCCTSYSFIPGVNKYKIGFSFFSRLCICPSSYWWNGGGVGGKCTARPVHNVWSHLSILYFFFPFLIMAILQQELSFSPISPVVVSDLRRDLRNTIIDHIIELRSDVRDTNFHEYASLILVLS